MALTVIPLSGLASDVVDSISAGAGGGGPRIANVQIANSSWGLLDDTAVSTDGGYVLINGSGFVSGCSVLVANSQATPVTFANSSLLRVEVPAKSASTYAVYVLNPDGGTAIGINALTYSAFPAWATGSTLSSGSADVEISVQLSASEATTYTLQAGSSLPANTTLTSGGLFSGTITGINEETTYTFTVEATDAQNQNTPRTFSITITVGDSYFKSTTLLLNADANTYVRDASDNAFAITVNGDTRPSAFSPYNTNWSNFFDGTGDYLSIAANSAFNIGASESFTVECWVYSTYTSNIQSIFNICDTGSLGYGSVRVQIKANQGFQFLAGPGGAWTVNIEQGTYTLGTWTHVAFVRNVNTFLCFVNGQQVGTATYSNALVQDRNTFISFNSGTAYPVNGYISNFRFVKGTALYTATFTPPTSSLTAVANTQLLTCQSNRLIDNSTNAFTITKNGDTKVTAFGPFTETDVTTGSGYFDGTGDSIVTSTYSNQLSFDTGDFTIEFWVYPSASSRQDWIDFRAESGTKRIQIYYSGSAIRYDDGEPAVQVLSYTLSAVNLLNQWKHIAVTRSSGQSRLFVDGALVAGPTTDSFNSSAPFSVSLGRDTASSTYVTGYISNLRIIKGTALYTSAFTPPTSPLTSVANTQLLTLQNRTGITNHQFVDESGINHLFTRGGNASQGSFSPYSPTGWSGYFDGTGDYLSFTKNTTTGSFTCECWFYRGEDTGGGYHILFSGSSIASVNPDNVQFYATNTGAVAIAMNGAAVISPTGTAVTKNQWNHIAYVRSGSSLAVFVNGSRIGTGTSSAALNVLHVGTYLSSYLPIGYISNARIVNAAVYDPASTSITVPTTPLTPVANTYLLTLRGSGLTDDGPNRLAITRNGDVKIEPFSPFKSHTITANTHSVYFDTSGDYLAVPYGSTLALGTGNCTIEAWIYLASFPQQYNNIVDVRESSGTFGGDAISFSIENDGTFNFWAGSYSSSTQVLETVSGRISLNVWYHIAMTRVSGTTKLYINGVEEATSTNAWNQTSSTATTMYICNALQTRQVNGYVSNLRIVKGTAVYTSAFTPSTTPLTAISNTVLLTCQSTTIIDNSTNAFTITATGNVIPSKFNPFGETIAQGVEYRANTHGGSAYFDGTDDNLITSSSSNLALDSGDFTIEMWVYPNNTSSAYRGLIASDAYSGTTNGWTVYQYGTNIEMYYSSGGSTPNIFTASSVLVAGVWQHVAISRSSGTLKCFVNGVQVASVSNSIAFVGSIIYIGDNNAGNYFYSGYISDVRIVKGTALYKAAFIPPTTTLGAIKETVLLLNNDRGGIMDVSSRNILECVGDTKVRTDTKKYGTGSMYFDGTGDYLAIRPTNELYLGSANFTIEGWIYPTSVVGASGYNAFFGMGYAVQIYWYNNSVLAAFNDSDDSLSYLTTNLSGPASSASANTWSHFAVVRNGSTWTTYVNGTAGTPQSFSGTIAYSSTLTSVGALAADTQYRFAGYIDDLRVTKGVARYTTNFTAPTSAHQTK